MSIIIRLQNLPWTANSLDIRRYFAGLSIPEGGVHIVGGEKGDAFIAFGTDEDARQAMERDGGKIKEVKVKLLLSSRTEMSRVIELARNQNISLQVPAAVKAAAASDSDRRRAPSPRRKEREKSPPRERERRRSTKRDRSRSRSRSPPRKSKDRDRDSDRRVDRSRRDERHGDDLDRYKGSRDYQSREHDKRQYAMEEKRPPPRPSVDVGQTFDPRVGSTPQTYSSGPMEENPGSFNMLRENVPARNVAYVEPQKPEVPVYYPNTMNPARLTQDSQNAPEPTRTPAFNSGAFPFDKRSAVMGNYESKRPSPTPATSAPNVGSSAPYAKDYGQPDPYSSTIPHGYGDYPGAYNRAQTAERGTVPAVPNERRVFQSNPPAYGAEPHARYDLIPEANQAGRSSNTPAPKEMAGHVGGMYGKMLPANMPVIPASNAPAVSQPTRRSHFDSEFSAVQDDQFHAESGMMSNPRASFARQSDGANNIPKGMGGGFVHQRDRPPMGNEAPWPPPGQDRWGGDNRGMMMQQHSNPANEYRDDDVMMDVEEEHLGQVPAFHPSVSTPAPHLQNRNAPRHMPEARVPPREHYGYHNRHMEDKRHMEENRFMEDKRQMEENRFMEDKRHMEENRFMEGKRHMEENRFMEGKRHMEENRFMEGKRHMEETRFMEGKRHMEENRFMEGKRYMEENRFMEDKRHMEEKRFMEDKRHMEEKRFMGDKRRMGDFEEGKIPPNSREHVMSEAGRSNPMMNKKDKGPLTVEITGLSPNASEEDLAELLMGIFVPRGNMKCRKNHLGKAVGYVKFLNSRDFETALSRSNCRIRGSVVTISPCALAAYNSAPGAAAAHGKTPETDHASNKGKESAPVRKPPNYPHVGEQDKKAVEASKRKLVEQDVYQNRSVAPKNAPENANVRRTGDSTKAPDKDTSTRLPENVQQRKPEVVPQRKVQEPVSQAKKVDKKPDVKPLEPQRKKEPVPQTGSASEKPFDSAPEKNPADPSPQRQPVQGHKLPEVPVQRKSDSAGARKADPRPARKPSEPLLPPKPFEPHPPRGGFVPDRPKTPLIPRKHPDPMPPRNPRRELIDPNISPVRPPPPFHRSNLEPCEEDLCVELRGLPYSCEDHEVIQFFDGLGILDIYIELGPDGRATGVGFVEFATVADFHAALDLNGKRIGHRYIDVLVASKEIMAVARGERPKPPLLPQGPPRELAHAQPTSYCVAINDLPKHVKDHDIRDFFAKVYIIPRAIHIMFSPSKTPTGEAFAEFNSREELDTAMKTNGRILNGSRITVAPIPYQDMISILESSPLIPAAQGPLLMDPPENDFPPARRALMPLPMDEEMQMDDPRPHEPLHTRPDYLAEPRVPFDRPEPRLPGRGLPPRLRGVPPRPEGPRVRPGLVRRAASPRGPTAFRPRRPAPSRFPGPAHNGGEPADFGLPGCVVGIDNLHFRAGLEELLDFFQDYHVDKNSIIRKYNESGHPTGEARVAFNCHEDALHAVRELHMKPIMGRPISLSFV